MRQYAYNNGKIVLTILRSNAHENSNREKIQAEYVNPQLINPLP